MECTTGLMQQCRVSSLTVAVPGGVQPQHQEGLQDRVSMQGEGKSSMSRD